MWLQKQRYIIDFTISSLARRKGKNLALILVYTLVVFLPSSVMFYTHALKREAALLLRGAPELVVQRLSAGRQAPVPESSLAALREIKGVSGASGRLWGYYFDPVIGANYTVMAAENATPAQGEVFLGRGVARAYSALKGDRFVLRSYDGGMPYFIIRDIFPSDSELVSSDLILMSAPDFRRVFGIAPGVFTDLTLRVRNSRELDTIAGKIVARLPDYRPITRRDILRTYDAVFDWRGGFVIVVFAVAALAFILLAWDKASGLSADEKKEIGILKAVGWETSDVLLMKFWEGAIVSLISFSAGIAAAYFHVFFTSASLFAPFLKGWSVLYPEFRLVPFIDPYRLLALFFLTVAPYLAAVVVPSWRSASGEPDSVMRT
jgi:ABC-type lipoprotein release transport system permease subunit